MKRLVLCLALLATMLHAAFDQGGVSVDLSRARIPALQAQGEDILPPANGKLNDWKDFSGWRYGFNLGPRRGPTPKDPDLNQWFHCTVDNGNFLMEALEEGIAPQQDGKGKPACHSGAYRNIKVSEPGTYVLEFEIRSRLSKKPGSNAAYLFIQSMSKMDVKVGPQTRTLLALSPEFRKEQIVFQVPETTTIVRFSLHLYGMGRIETRNFALRKAAATSGLKATAMPWGFIPGGFRMPQGRACFLGFWVSNPSQEKGVRPRLELTLPKGVRVLGACPLYLEPPRQEGDRWIIPVLPRALQISRYGRGTSEVSLGNILMQSDLPAGHAPIPVRCRFQNNGRYGEETTFLLYTDPAPNSPQPKRFLTGFFFGSNCILPGDAVGVWTDSAAAMGFNAAKGALGGSGYNQAARENYQRNGFQTAIWPTQPGPSNGYDMGAADKPEEVKYRLLDGSHFMAGKGYNKGFLCPEVAAANEPYFQENVASILTRRMRDERHAFLISNWEPQDNFQGCWCDRCREAFIRDSKLPADQVRAAWPKEILGKWRPQWIRFRSRQNARVVVNTERAAAAGGGHFLPAVTSESLREATWQLYYQYAAPDYMDQIPWINSWGPYLFYNMFNAYEPVIGQQLKAYQSGREVKEFLAARIPDPARRPKLIAFPQCHQVETWITTPEAMAFETLSYFLNGWEGSMLYFFPNGADNRGFAAMARTNRIIAATEDIRFGGTRLPTPVAIPVSDLPKSSFHGNADVRHPALKDLEMLQCAAWKNGHRILLGVGNFWDGGECFFRLKLPGLKPDATYTLRTVDSGETFAPTGKELADGILLQVGALRWNLYTLDEGRPQGAVYTAADLEALLARRRPAIAKAAARTEAVRRQANADEIPPDYTGLKPAKAGGLQFQPQPGGKAEVTAPNYRLTLDFANGGTIVSWLIRGEQFAVTADGIVVNHASPIGSDAFWGRGGFLSCRPYAVQAVAAKDGALEVRLFRRLTKKDSIVHAGLELTKTYRFTPAKVSITTKVFNPDGESRDITFRFHSMPAFPERILGGKRLVRDYQKMLQAKPASMAWRKGALAVSAAVSPAERCSQFVFWDGGVKMPTFETLFQPVALTARTSQEYTIEFSLP